MRISASGMQKSIRLFILIIVALVHGVLLLYLKFNVASEKAAAPEEAKVIKLVDYQEYIPPPPPEPKPEKKIVQLAEQPAASETVIAVEEEIEIVETLPVAEAPPEPVYLPQHKISKIPEIPTDLVQERMVYPAMALRQGIEAVVYVELYIDEKGLIRKIVVLKDPGRGFAEAAVVALEGLQCRPAEANGTAVPVRYRYPIRFVLN